jgi:hypothetical protein
MLLACLMCSLKPLMALLGATLLIAAVALKWVRLTPSESSRGFEVESETMERN